MTHDSSSPDLAHRSKRRRRIFFAILGTAVVLTFAGAYLSGQVERYLRRLLWPERSSELEINFTDLPTQTNSALITVRGKANREAQIELFLDGKLVGRTLVEDLSRWTSSGKVTEENVFEFTDVLLHPGTNTLVARARFGTPRNSMGAEINQTVQWWPDKDTRPQLWKPPKKVTTEPVALQGVAYPGSTVRIKLMRVGRVGGLSVPTNDVLVVANDQGFFLASQSLPAPGRYSVASQLENEQNILPSPDATVIEYDPLAIHKLDIKIAFHEISLDAETTLSRDNEAVGDLISGRTPLLNFIWDQYGLSIGDSLMGNEFSDVTPSITLDDKKAVIRAHATSPRGKRLPIRNGTFELAKGFERLYPLDGPQDTLSVSVKDYDVKGYSPAPTKIDAGVATWSGARDPLDYTRNVKVFLTYNPFRNVRSLLQLFALSPYETVSYNISSFFSFIFAFLYSVPVLWLIALLDKYPQIPSLSKDYVSRIRRIAFGLLSLIFVSTIQHLSYGLEGWAFERRWLIGIGALMSNRPLGMVITNLIVWGVLLTLISIARLLFRRRQGPRLWLRSLSRGLNLAIIIRLALDAFYVGLYQVGQETGQPLVPSMIIATVVLWLLWGWIKQLRWWSPTKTWWSSLILMLVLLGLAYPGGQALTSFGGREFPVWQVTIANVELFFSLLQEALPYILFLGILQILKHADQQETEKPSQILSMSLAAENRPLILSLSLLVFSCYVVGTTANWFIIPIPFLLALFLYHRLVELRYAKLQALQSLKLFVIERRSWIFKKVFELSAAQRIISSLDQIEKKISSGDLSVEDFTSRKDSLESYAERVRGENKVAKELDARDLALSIGPHTTNWSNGLHAVRWGLLISLPFLVLFIFTFLLKRIGPNTTFVSLWAFIRLLTFVGDWAIAAFFFGYFFNHLRGESGLKKGLNVALVIIICFMPVWLTSGLSPVELSATFLRAGQIFLFFTVLGVCAFDYFTFRSVLQEQFSWRRFAKFGDMASFTAVASVFVTSAGVAFSSVISGQFVSLVAHLVTAIFPDLPAPARK